MARLLITLFVLSCLILPGCSKSTKPDKPKFNRNPDLTFLTRAHDPPGDEGFWECSFPVWSPAGDKIYYIESRFEWCDYVGRKGHIWEIGIDGANAKLFKEGDYVYLSMSPDGEELVALIRDYRYTFPGGILVLIDLSTLEEYIVPMPDTNAFVFGAEYTTDGTKLVYYAVFGYSAPTPEAYYCFDFSDSSTSLLFEEDWEWYYGFDLYGDEIATVNRIRKLDGSEARLLKMGGCWPEFSPDGEKLLAVTGYGAYFLGGNLMHLIDAKACTLIVDLDIQTHELSTAAFQYWSPNGEKIVFASRPWGGDNQRGNAELWILNKIK